MVSINFNMANPDQITILIEKAFIDIKEICIRFQEDSGASNSEVQTLLREVTCLWNTKEKNKFGFR